MCDVVVACRIDIRCRYRTQALLCSRMTLCPGHGRLSPSEAVRGIEGTNLEAICHGPIRRLALTGHLQVCRPDRGSMRLWRLEREVAFRIVVAQPVSERHPAGRPGKPLIGLVAEKDEGRLAAIHDNNLSPPRRVLGSGWIFVELTSGDAMLRHVMASPDD